jgi:ribosomal protein S18 acetylase RimI-like enzyme
MDVDEAPRHNLLLPEQLTSRSVTLRRETEGDGPFLAHLYRSVRWEELAPVGWPDDTKIAFLASQFELQTQHYQTHYRNADFWIVTRNGESIGRLYLHRGPHEFRIVDISLLPEARGHGLGTALLQTTCRAAANAGASITIHVERDNPALRLYRRLGFRHIGEDGPYFLLAWSAPAATS